MSHLLSLYQELKEQSKFGVPLSLAVPKPLVSPIVHFRRDNKGVHRLSPSPCIATLVAGLSTSWFPNFVSPTELSNLCNPTIRWVVATFFSSSSHFAINSCIAVSCSWTFWVALSSSRNEAEFLRAISPYPIHRLPWFLGVSQCIKDWNASSWMCFRFHFQN